MADRRPHRVFFVLATLAMLVGILLAVLMIDDAGGYSLFLYMPALFGILAVALVLLVLGTSASLRARREETADSPRPES